MSTEIATIDPKQFGLEESKAQEMTSGLSVTLEERKVLIDQYNQVISLEITEANLPIFKDLRIKIRDNRTKGILKWHETNKEFYLRGGQFVDAIKKREIVINEAMEEKLAGAEKHFENLEKERIANLQKERVEMLRPYEVENLEQLDLGNMDTFVFDSFLSGVKTSFDAKKEREDKIEKERVEKERIETLNTERRTKALPYFQYWTEFEKTLNLGEMSEVGFDAFMDRNFDAKEEADRVLEAQRLENDRLKKEAEEREAVIKKEREEAEEKARKEKEESDRILAEEKAKQQAELDRIAKQKSEQDAILEARSKELQPYIVFIRDYNGLIKKSEEEYQKEFADIKIGAEQHWEFERKEQIRKQEEADKKEAENKAILEAERKEKARIEKELQDKKDAEAKEEQAKKDAEEKAKKDAEKLAKQSLQKQRQAWINQFSAPSTELNDTKTEEIKTRFAGFITWANQINNQ